MEVILLERVAKLGQMGDVVRVKDGFARNFLLPRGKALRATEENRGRFEGMKTELVARSQTLKTEASGVAEAQWQELHCSSPSFGNRPAVRLGVATRPRRPHQQLWLRRQSQSDRVEYADQDHRPAQRADFAASRDRDHDHRDRGPQ